MNQMTWIILGGVAVVAIAVLLYVTSGESTFSGKTNPSTATPVTLTSEPDPVIPTERTTPASTSPTLKTPPTQVSVTEKEATTVPTVTLRTNLGNITLALYTKDAPRTVENFMKLVDSGFYDGIKFHRVIKGFMIQGGDPLTKDDTKMSAWGTGGPGYKFADEIAPQSPVYQKGYKRGILAMANSGPNTNGSQFFIMHKDYPLPPSYTIFGEVVSGLDVVDAIANVGTDANDRPITPVTIMSAVASN